MDGTRPPWTEIHRANVVIRESGLVLDATAEHEGWPVPFSPVRFLVLAHLEQASTFGLTPGRLAHMVRMRPSSFAHHLDRLEEAGLVDRAPRRIRDGRRVAVRLTREGLYATLRLESALRRRPSVRALVTGSGPG